MEEIFKIGDFTFESKEEYEKGIQDLKYIKKISGKINLNDVNEVKKFLNALNKSKFEFETEIGKKFVDNLKKKLVDSNHYSGISVKDNALRSNTEIPNNHSSNTKKTEINENIKISRHQDLKNEKRTKIDYSVNPFISYLPMVYMMLLILFPVPVGMLVIGIAIFSGLLAIFEYISNYKWYTIIYLMVSIFIPPIGIILTVIAVIKKFKYILLNGKMILCGFVFYLGTAYLELQLFNLRYDQYGMPGIIDVINQWKELSQHKFVGLQIIMLIIYIAIFIGALIFSIRVSKTFYGILKVNSLRGINNIQTVVFILKAPFTILLLFLPAIVGSLAGDIFDQILDDHNIDIDNNDHYVRPYTKHTIDGEEVNVQGHYRMNPDDIVENNYSYKGK